VANLKRKALVSDHDGRVRLTAAGLEQAEDLWSIAQEQQDKVFSAFSAEQIDTFTTVLKQLISHAG